MLIKEQNFGVEIELTGVTREQAAGIIANYFGTNTRYLGTHYKTWSAKDRKNRVWKAMSDASITTQRRADLRTVTAIAYIMTPGRSWAQPSPYYLRVIRQGYDDFRFDHRNLLYAARTPIKGASA